MKKALKIIGWTLLSIVLLVVVAVTIAMYVVFTPERLTPIARQAAAKFITCETYVCTGFADELCPPSNVFAMYNNIPASTQKEMTTNPLTGHYGTTKNVKGNKRIEEYLRGITVRKFTDY